MLDLKQTVTVPTHQSGSILDLIFTNLADHYKSPHSLGPLQNSDHFVLLWEATANFPEPKKTRITTRFLSKESIYSFGRWIGTFSFEEICSVTDLNLKVESLYFPLLNRYHEHFPTKTVVVSESDKPWVMQEIKAMIKTRCQLHSSGQLPAANKLRNHIVKGKKRC
jgi:hypothetical protein